MIDAVVAAGILSAIELAEGIRQLPPSAIVLRRFAFGPWRFVRHGELGTGLRLVSWCLPLSMPVILHADSAVPKVGWRRSLHRMRARSRRTRGTVVALRILGLVTIVALVAGLPIAVDRFGLFGLSFGIGALFALSGVQALLAARALRRNGMSTKSAALAALKLLSPFSAPRAAEVVWANAVSGVPALAAAYELLGDESFVRSMRPVIYDAILRREPSDIYDSLITVATSERFLTMLRTPPPGFAGSPFCPRCGTEFAASVSQCSDCADVALVQGVAWSSVHCPR